MAGKRKFKPKGGGEITLNLGRVFPKQAEFMTSTTLYTGYGGARGGGKSHAIRIHAINVALTYAGIKILIVRRTYGDLEENHIIPILNIVVPKELATYKGDTHTLTFINGSTIKFGHYQGTASNTEYQGKEYDYIFIDEATQFSESEFRIFGGCCRGVNPFPKHIYITCNPGGVGHQWVKRLFIDKQYKTNCENPEENEDPLDYSFIFATVEDNEAMREANPKAYKQYLQMLSALPENIRRAHRYGDWNALGGNYFPEFSTTTHVIKPFPIPQSWIRYRSFDYGLDALACYWVAVDPVGRSYVYRELKASNLIVSEAADAIRYNTGIGEKIAVTFAPPDMWTTLKDTGKTMAEVFMLNGINIVKSSNNRVQGHLQIKEMLAPMPEKDKPPEEWRPGLLIFNNCENLINDLQVIQSDEKNPNDCAKQPHDITHTVDGLRYYCISRVLAAEESAPVVEEPEDEDAGEDYDEFMHGGEATSSYINYSGGR